MMEECEYNNEIKSECKSENSQNSQSSDPHMTFYYSNFELFDESSDFLFMKYQIFKKQLIAYLG